jgi:hypothetical protein
MRNLPHAAFRMSADPIDSTPWLPRRAVIGAALSWLAVLPFAFANGWLRERVLVEALGLVPARLASGALLCVAILAVAWLAMPKLAPLSRRQWWRIGALWLVLTFAFETGGNLAGGATWRDVLLTYAFAGGNPWPLVLLVAGLAPVFAARVRGLWL